MDEFEAKRRERLKDVVEGPFAATRPTRGIGGDLEAANKVEGQRTEELPGRIGAAVVGGNGREGQPDS